jgi:iron complex transport system ATP-binding protein
MSPLTFEQVTFGYDIHRGDVISSLNFSIAQGAITAILGPNGSGKTTLLYLALGWLKPKAGVIRLGKKPLSAYSRREIGRTLALVPQSESVPFEYSALEITLLGQAPHLANLAMPAEQDITIAMQALEQVGMAGLAAQPVTALSGGERQLVFLARALAQQPKILLLDEPTAHLDLHNAHRLANILRQSQQQGTTILLTSHDPQLVTALADEAILIKKGQILKKGLAKEVLTDPLLSQLYQLPVKVREVDGKRFIEWL